MTGEERTCRVQVLVDGHAVADCECLSCAVEIERGGLKVSVEPGGPHGDVREWRRCGYGGVPQEGQARRLPPRARHPRRGHGGGRAEGAVHVVSDDERRRIAERLRGLRRGANNVTQLNHGPTWSLAWCVLGDGLDECGTGDWFERMCARLADLIDPGESGHESGQNRDSVHIDSPAVQKAPECDRDALLELADDVEEAEAMAVVTDSSKWARVFADMMLDIARRIREACGEVES